MTNRTSLPNLTDACYIRERQNVELSPELRPVRASDRSL